MDASKNDLSAQDASPNSSRRGDTPTVAQLNADIHARVALRDAASTRLLESSLVYFWGGRLWSIYTTLHHYLLVWPVTQIERMNPLVLVLPPLIFTPSATLGVLRGQPYEWLLQPPSELWLLLVYTFPVIALLAYVVDVLARVPWAAPFSHPLVLTLEVKALYELEFGLRLTGRLLLIKAAVLAAIWYWSLLSKPEIYLSMAWGSVVHGMALLALLWLFKYLNREQPAFGFVKWTEEDNAQWDSARVYAAQQQDAHRQAVTKTPVDDPDYVVPFEVTPATLSFKDIHGMEALKAKLLAPARLVLAGTDASNPQKPRNGILLFGEPGNGKTVFAEALAGELGVPFMNVSFGPVVSKWMGQTPQMMARVFAKARSSAPCVMFVDEIDSFIYSRDTPETHSETRAVTNVMLTEMVNLRGSGVLLVGATNLMEKLDAAAVREGRFDFKIEITSPDEAARLGLLTKGLQQHAPQLRIAPEALRSIAQRWNGFSAARLLSICQELPGVVADPTREVAYPDWLRALREVQGQRAKVPAGTLDLKDMVFPQEMGQALVMLANRVRNLERTERLGGTLPSGVLFYGPPGTGKTAGAKALAKAAGWSFLSASGPDLLTDRQALDRLYREAKDLRPAVVFIDEADDILRHRQMSQTPDMVNKLLTLMDGVDDKVKDIVWIAATNNPEHIDPALLRAGRFTEKLRFAPPDTDQIPELIQAFLKQRCTALASDVAIKNLVHELEGQSVANITGVLQHALNLAISRGDGDMVLITDEDLKNALSTVLAGN